MINFEVIGKFMPQRFSHKRISCVKNCHHCEAQQRRRNQLKKVNMQVVWVLVNFDGIQLGYFRRN
jgi:hypothetical protein